MNKHKKQNEEQKSEGAQKPHHASDGHREAAKALHLVAHAVPTRSAEEERSEEVAESLEAIYEGKPSKEWMNTMEKGSRKTWVFVLGGIAGFLALLSVLSWVGYWWWGSRGFSGTGLEISIEGPPEVTIGKSTTFFINWRNVAKEPLASTELRISFPNDFVMTDVSPQPNDEPLVFRLGSRAADAHGTVKVTGMFTGALGTKSALQVIGTYKPASFNSDFETLVTKELTYTDSVLEGTLAVPAKALPGDNIVIAYTVHNKGNDPISGLEARIRLPDGFVRDASSSNDALDGTVLRRSIGSLAGNASTTVEVTGSFALGASGDAVIHAEAGTITRDENFAPAQKIDATVTVLPGDLSTVLLINGSDTDRSVALGEWQRITISFQNISGVHLKRVQLALHLDPGGDNAKSPIDWDKLQDGNGGERKGNTLVFSDKQLDSLADIPPNGEGSIELSVPIRSSAASLDDVPVHAFVEAAIATVDDVDVNRMVTTKPIIMTLESDASFSAEAAYTAEEGIALGSGPLPPVVGQSTRYRIFWKVSKSLHALERIKVTATLPGGVAWGSVKEVEAGDVGYDPDKRLVTWSVNKMPSTVDSVLISFDVVLTPSEADVGRFAKLLGETRMDSTDAHINETLIRTSPALTTDIPDDALAKGKGVVSRP